MGLKMYLNETFTTLKMTDVLQWKAVSIGSPIYTLSNFKIRHVVTCRRLLILGELPLNLCVVYAIVAKHACFMVIHSEAQNLLEVTSHIISIGQSVGCVCKILF